MTVHETVALPPSPPTDRLPPEVREMVAEYALDLTDGRSVLLRLDHGVLSLEERAAGEPDCHIRLSKEALPRMLTGELNLITALMRGDVRVKGNLESAKRLYRYLRISKDLGGHS